MQQINQNEEYACTSASLATWSWCMDAGAGGQKALSLGVDRVEGAKTQRAVGSAEKLKPQTKLHSLILLNIYCWL